MKPQPEKESNVGMLGFTEPEGQSFFLSGVDKIATEIVLTARNQTILAHSEVVRQAKILPLAVDNG